MSYSVQMSQIMAYANTFQFSNPIIESNSLYRDIVASSFTFAARSFFHRAFLQLAAPVTLRLPTLSVSGDKTLYIVYFTGVSGSSLVFEPDAADRINQNAIGVSVPVASTGIVQLVLLFACEGVWHIGSFSNAAANVTTVSAGTAISITGVPPNYIVNNTAPDQVVSLTAGTGISTSGSYPNFTITNTAPDQTVSLTAGTGISISGTYPNFTIASTMTTKYLQASTTTPASYVYGPSNVVFTAANTFSSTSGNWTNTGGGFITYTGTPALFEAVIRVRCTSSTGLFEPVPNLYINGQWTNQVMTGFTPTSGAIDVEYCFGILNYYYPTTSHDMSTIPLFTGDVIGIFFRSNNGLSGTASNLQYTFKIISK